MVSEQTDSADPMSLSDGAVAAPPRPAPGGRPAARDPYRAIGPYIATAGAQGLPEFRHYRPAPGHPDWQKLQDEALQLAAELRGLLERPRTGPAEWRRRLRSYVTAGRNYLDNRRLIREGREDLRPLYFIWTLLRTCNFRCDYCDDHRGRKYPDLPDDDVLDTRRSRQLLKMMRTRAPSVYFAGGEPTVRQDLPQLTREARDLNYYPIITNTNASLLHSRLKQAHWKTWLADMDIIIVSLDALDLRLLNDMWVYRKSHDVIRNLLMLRELRDEYRFKLMVNCVIQPGRIAEAEAVLDLAYDLDIWFCPVPVNTGPVIDAALRDDADYARIVEKILRRKREGQKIIGSYRMNERLLRSEKLICRNALKPHIDSDGRLAWPCKASVNVEPAMIDVLKFDDVDALYEHACGQVDPRGFHGPGAKQCGANCNWAQNYTTDAYTHGLLHPAALLTDILEFLRA